MEGLNCLNLSLFYYNRPNLFKNKNNNNNFLTLKRSTKITLQTKHELKPFEPNKNSNRKKKTENLPIETTRITAYRSENTWCGGVASKPTNYSPTIQFFPEKNFNFSY